MGNCKDCQHWHEGGAYEGYCTHPKLNPLPAR